jgi:hypothetical protein
MAPHGGQERRSTRDRWPRLCGENARSSSPLLSQVPVPPIAHDSPTRLGEQLVDLPDVRLDCRDGDAATVGVAIAQQLLRRDANIASRCDRIDDRRLERRHRHAKALVDALKAAGTSLHGSIVARGLEKSRNICRRAAPAFRTNPARHAGGIGQSFPATQTVRRQHQIGPEVGEALGV